MKLSIIIPTYNNDKTIDACLNSIYSQEFSRRDLEILIIDGGSNDKTLEIVRKYPARILHNKKRVEEPARIMGVKKAKGEIFAFIDADNVLPDKFWLKKMTAPFNDKEIFFADTLYFERRIKDPIKIRYQALIGDDNPLAIYLGFYSRWCYFKDNWTGCPYISEQHKGYIKAKFTDKDLIPSMGSNGFLIRSKIIKRFVKRTFIHSDIIYELVNKGYNCFAKVDTGIVHDQPTFFKNKIRRMKRRLHGQINIKYSYGLDNKKIFLLFLRGLLVLPILYDMIKGFFKKPDSAWLFHIPAFYTLLFLQGYYHVLTIINRIGKY